MRHKQRTDEPLAELAERQHGVVSARQLHDLGYTRNSISRAKRSGRLRQLHRGVYAVGHREQTWHSRCLAAVLFCEPNAVASHLAAAWLWGLIRYRPDALDVTAATRRHAKTEFRLHYAPLIGADRAVREAVPLTAVPRTLLDLAANLPAERFARVLERAEELGLFDLGPVDALLARTSRHPGAGRLRNALALYRPPPFTRSGLERRFLDLVEGAGLPTPSTGCNVAGHELDAYWEAERFAVELDVYETHGSRRSFESDRLRQETLMLHGVAMIRVTGHRLDREPAQVLRRLATLLARRRPSLQ